MARRKNWWPDDMPAQVLKCKNIIEQIDNFTAVLPLTVAQRDKIVTACETIIKAIEYTDQSRNTAKGLVTWRTDVIYGAQGPLTAAPPFGTVAMPAGATNGAFADLSEGRQIILDAPGYEESTGEAMDLLGDEITPPVNFQPDLTLEAQQQDFKIKVKGSMQGKKILRLEYKATSAVAWNPFAFLDELPAVVSVPVTGDDPQTGHVRGIFVENNEPVGSYTPDYPVTLTP